MQPRIAIAPLAALDDLISTAGYEYIITPLAVHIDIQKHIFAT